MSKDIICLRTGKVKRTKEDAEARVPTYKIYMRAYECEFCRTWHLTSRLPREYEDDEEPEERDVY